MKKYRNAINHYLFYKKIYPVFRIIFFIQVIFLFTCTCQAVNYNNSEKNIDFTEFSLEELKNITITSASKKPEKLSETASAVYVISNEDIRRSGATSIPEILRMAPGVQVARISATEWAVNMRDVNQLFANKLLVLMDGRSIYNHVFSGVFWDIYDTVIEDIERIEVIRGPGAALWGANAVNGVINIITKNAAKTQEGYFSAVGGSEEGIGALRYGGSFASNGYYRIYAKYFNRGRLFENDRDIKNDPSKGDWRSGRTGFRVDWEPDKRENIFSFQGELNSGQFQTDLGKVSLESPYFQTDRETSRSKGGHILGRWQHLISETSDSVFQFYFDSIDKDFEAGNVKANILDLDFQHQFSPFEGHELLWGLNWRIIADSFKDSADISTDPDTEEQYLYSFLVQDKIELIPDYLTLSIGSKFEHNDYTGTEIQPDARLLWTPLKNHTFWGAVSKAVRVPSRFEHDAVFNEQVIEPDSQSGMPTLIKRLGNDGLDAESLIAYEIGYGFQPIFDEVSNLWINMAAFFHDYDNLISLEQRPSYQNSEPVLHQVSPLEYENNLRGESYGIELSALWHVIPDWRLQCSYTFLEAKTYDSLEENEENIQRIFVDGANPKNQISVRSSLDMSRQIELDLWLRYVGSLSNHDVDDYTSLDARINWKPIPLFELALVGQNLFEKHHSEYSSLEIERSFYFKLEWFF